MNILITGGAGFIGSNLANHMVESGEFDSISILDDLSTGSARNVENLDVTLVKGSILDFDLVCEMTADVDAVVHLGAIPSVPRSIANPRASHEANTTGTLNILEAARMNSVEHVIVASSSSVYGSNPTLPKSELDWTRPMSPYAVSKQATEAYALAYQASYGIPTLAFRFFNVYGPGQSANHDYAAVIPKFIDAALSGLPVTIHGDGTQSRDFTYVDTVCEVITDSVRRRISDSQPINLAFSTNTSLLALLEHIETIIGHPIPRTFVAPRIGDVRASQAESSRLNSLFSDIRATSLSEGLTTTIDWFRDNFEYGK